jgi:hypothetical protein
MDPTKKRTKSRLPDATEVERAGFAGLVARETGQDGRSEVHGQARHDPGGGNEGRPPYAVAVSESALCFESVPSYGKQLSGHRVRLVRQRLPGFPTDARPRDANNVVRRVFFEVSDGTRTRDRLDHNQDPGVRGPELGSRRGDGQPRSIALSALSHLAVGG